MARRSKSILGTETPLLAPTTSAHSLFSVSGALPNTTCANTGESSKYVDVTLDHHVEKRGIVVDGVHGPTKQGCAQRALRLFHGEDARPKLVHLQSGFNFASPDTLVAILGAYLDLSSSGIYLEHLDERSLSSYAHQHDVTTTIRGFTVYITKDSFIQVKALYCGVTRKRLAHDTPAFIGDLNRPEIQ